MFLQDYELGRKTEAYFAFLAAAQKALIVATPA
jgi:hypothetical protein